MEVETQQAIVFAYIEDVTRRGRLYHKAQEAARAGAMLIGADSGGEAALAWNLKLNRLVGDMDSISPATLAAWRETPGVQIAVSPVEKDETDLELALYAALDAGARDITILGGLGGRLDHTLGNLYLLASSRLAAVQAQVRLLGEQEEVYLLRGGQTLAITGQPGELLSLLAMSSMAEGVCTTGLYYPLRSEPLYLGPSRGVSNLFTAATATISLDQGLLLVIHSFGPAPLAPAPAD